MKYLVTASTNLPNGKRRTMARVMSITRFGTPYPKDPALWAAEHALWWRRDRGHPFLGEAIRVTPLIGPLMDHGKPVEFVFNPDTHELDKL